MQNAKLQFAMVLFFNNNYKIDFTASTTWFVVNPNFSNKVAAGAEAPNPFIEITTPSRPTYFSQP